MKKITKQKAIIYLGGSYPQIQGVKAIKKAGVIVILIDHHPSAPCAKYADIHLKFSVTDTNSIMNYFQNHSNILRKHIQPWMPQPD